MWIGKGPTFLDTLCIGVEHGVAPYILDTYLGRNLGKFFVEQPSLFVTCRSYSLD
jgi:hypothetical protein